MNPITKAFEPLKILLLTCLFIPFVVDLRPGHWASPWGITPFQATALSGPALLLPQALFSWLIVFLIMSLEELRTEKDLGRCRDAFDFCVAET